MRKIIAVIEDTGERRQPVDGENWTLVSALAEFDLNRNLYTHLTTQRGEECAILCVICSPELEQAMIILDRDPEPAEAEIPTDPAGDYPGPRGPRHSDPNAMVDFVIENLTPPPAEPLADVPKSPVVTTDPFESDQEMPF